ncbi:MAG: thiamine biosynthesis protein ThiC, partial [Pseudomonadota bacterium]
MDFTIKQTVQVVAGLLIALALTQAVYTALYIAKADVPRQLLWGLEGVLFVFLAAFAGAALVESKRLAVAWSAIACSAVLNVVQVGVGLTMFGPFREVAQGVEALAPAAGAVELHQLAAGRLRAVDRMEAVGVHVFGLDRVVLAFDNGRAAV